MMECSLLGWLNFIVLTATGAVIAWYTWETRRLRQESQQEFSFPRLRVTIAAPATPDQASKLTLISTQAPLRVSFRENSRRR